MGGIVSANELPRTVSHPRAEGREILDRAQMDTLARLYQGGSMRAYAKLYNRCCPTGCPPQSLTGGNRVGSLPALNTLVLEWARRGLATQVETVQAEQPKFASVTHVRVGALEWMKQRSSSDSQRGTRRRLAAALGSLALGLSGTYYTMSNWSGTQKVRRITVFWNSIGMALNTYEMFLPEKLQAIPEVMLNN
eukprot:221413-Prorocentrum_minimum.AAC.3